MISGYIRLTEVLKEMDRVDSEMKPVPFDIKFVTHDIKRNTGGQIIEVKNAVKCVGKKNGKLIIDKREALTERAVKDPHHFLNATRNIALENGQIRKLHIRLILEFNGKKVCY